MKEIKQPCFQNIIWCTSWYCHKLCNILAFSFQIKMQIYCAIVVWNIWHKVFRKICYSILICVRNITPSWAMLTNVIITDLIHSTSMCSCGKSYIACWVRPGFPSRRFQSLQIHLFVINSLWKVDTSRHRTLRPCYVTKMKCCPHLCRQMPCF